MINETNLREKLQDYAAGKIAFLEFQNWFIGRYWTPDWPWCSDPWEGPSVQTKIRDLTNALRLSLVNWGAGLISDEGIDLILQSTLEELTPASCSECGAKGEILK